MDIEQRRIPSRIKARIAEGATAVAAGFTGLTAATTGLKSAEGWGLSTVALAAFAIGYERQAAQERTGEILTNLPEITSNISTVSEGVQESLSETTKGTLEDLKRLSQRNLSGASKKEQRARANRTKRTVREVIKVVFDGNNPISQTEQQALTGLAPLATRRQRRNIRKLKVA